MTSTQQRGEAIRGGRAAMMHAGPVHYYCCRRRILDPRPAPNCQLRDSRKNHQGPTWARWARCMALGRGRDERPGCQGATSVGGGGVEGVVTVRDGTLAGRTARHDSLTFVRGLEGCL